MITADICIIENDWSRESHASKIIVIGKSCDDAIDPMPIVKKNFTRPPLANFASVA